MSDADRCIYCGEIIPEDEWFVRGATAPADGGINSLLHMVGFEMTRGKSPCCAVQLRALPIKPKADRVQELLIVSSAGKNRIRPPALLNDVSQWRSHKNMRTERAAVAFSRRCGSVAPPYSYVINYR